MDKCEIKTSSIPTLIKETARLIAEGWELDGESTNGLGWQDNEPVVTIRQPFKRKQQAQQSFSL